MKIWQIATKTRLEKRCIVTKFCSPSLNRTYIKVQRNIFFDADRWILFKHNDEDSFCNKSDADENNTDDIRFVRNEVPKKLTFEMLSETLNNRNCDPVVPQERKICKANVGKYKVLTWTADKPNVSRKWNESNIIRNKPRPSRRAKDIKTPLDSWSLLMTDDILLEIVTTTHENI